MKRVFLFLLLTIPFIALAQQENLIKQEILDERVTEYINSWFDSISNKELTITNPKEEPVATSSAIEIP